MARRSSSSPSRFPEASAASRGGANAIAALAAQESSSMGLFDFFKKDKAKGDQSKAASAAAKWAEAAGNKRAQNYDRQEALHELANMGTAEAAEALLKRFTFNTDPSITDQEEKELAFQGVLKAGVDAVPVVRAFAAKAESLAWPMKIMKELMSEEELVDELLAWLSKWDTEYAKFIDPKLQILVALEDYRSPKIREAVEPFLEDVNDEARYFAASTVLVQNDPESVPALVKLYVDEESIRIKNKVADGMASRAWIVPEEMRDEMRRALTPDYSVDGEGRVKKR